MEKIESFEKEFAFLSNFYHSPIECSDGLTYPTAEHAFQAMKTTNLELRKKIAAARTPGKAKRMGRRLALRPGWDDMKLEVMYEIVRVKFFSSRILKIQLLATGNRELVEGNYWHDTFWGVCNGQGENHLGKILMRVREELQIMDQICAILLHDSE